MARKERAHDAAEEKQQAALEAAEQRKAEAEEKRQAAEEKRLAAQEHARERAREHEACAGNCMVGCSNALQPSMCVAGCITRDCKSTRATASISD